MFDASNKRPDGSIEGIGPKNIVFDVTVATPLPPQLSENAKNPFKQMSRKQAAIAERRTIQEKQKVRRYLQC